MKPHHWQATTGRSPTGVFFGLYASRCPSWFRYISLGPDLHLRLAGPLCDFSGSEIRMGRLPGWVQQRLDRFSHHLTAEARDRRAITSLRLLGMIGRRRAAAMGRHWYEFPSRLCPATDSPPRIHHSVALSSNDPSRRIAVLWHTTSRMLFVLWRFIFGNSHEAARRGHTNEETR